MINSILFWNEKKRIEKQYTTIYSSITNNINIIFFLIKSKISPLFSDIWVILNWLSIKLKL